MKHVSETILFKLSSVVGMFSYLQQNIGFNKYVLLIN